MKCNGCGRKQLWMNFEAPSRHSPGGSEQNHKNISQESLSPFRDLNSGHSEYEARVLTTLPRRSVVEVLKPVISL
jgi:hypothetical protein